MNKYFVKKAEGDLGQVQRIVAKAGHADLVRKTLGLCSAKFGLKDGRMLLKALISLFKELNDSYFEKAGGLYVPAGKGRKFVQFDKLTFPQIIGSWASVQLMMGKWVNDILTLDLLLLGKISEDKLVFAANDVEVVMELLFKALRSGGSCFCFSPEEDGLGLLEQQIVRWFSADVLVGDGYGTKG